MSEGRRPEAKPYAGALMFYNSVKTGAKSNISGAKTIYDDLSTRFPGRPVKASATTATATAK